MLSTQGSANGFYTINLATGTAGFVGEIGAGGLRSSIVDIAAAPLVAPPGGGGNAPLPAGVLLALPAAALAMNRARRLRK
jgi:hypothetical protein